MSLAQVLLEIRADAESRAKRSTGEGYTYERGRIDAVDQALASAAEAEEAAGLPLSEAERIEAQG